MDDTVIKLINMKRTIESDIYRLESEIKNLKDTHKKLLEKLKNICPHNDIYTEIDWDGHKSYRYTICTLCNCII
ncbi:MAG: hypothetical protein Homavirus35_2 [Homavirus sp.]|uniref:Uncharacterized protein n=1 Tax=Homavirus sp. TaxID=2487769 RepID=A0A3G5A871_9VIRU|nr:MAG: hypothetical protein Homavirus35_2 [Homavirus sp.]